LVVGGRGLGLCSSSAGPHVKDPCIEHLLPPIHNPNDTLKKKKNTLLSDHLCLIHIPNDTKTKKNISSRLFVPVPQRDLLGGLESPTTHPTNQPASQPISQSINQSINNPPAPLSLSLSSLRTCASETSLVACSPALACASIASEMSASSEPAACMDK
jgi:hypothetical protein